MGKKHKKHHKSERRNEEDGSMRKIVHVAWFMTLWFWHPGEEKPHLKIVLKIGGEGVYDSDYAASSPASYAGEHSVEKEKTHKKKKKKRRHVSDEQPEIHPLKIKTVLLFYVIRTLHTMPTRHDLTLRLQIAGSKHLNNEFFLIPSRHVYNHLASSYPF